MKLTKTLLIELIKQEINEVGLCHSPDTGRWAKCEAGAVYSLTSKGAKDNNIDNKYVQRGTVTKKKAGRGEPTKVSAKFGINTSGKKAAGRKKITGDDISPRYSVSKYPDEYQEDRDKTTEWNPEWPSAKKNKRLDRMGRPNRKNWFYGYDELDKLSRGKVGLLDEQSFTMDEILTVVETVLDIAQEVELDEGNPVGDQCRKMGFVTMREAHRRIQQGLNAYALAQAGELNKPAKKS